MARVLIDDRDIESAVAVRQAAEADGHTTEIISSIDGLDRSLAGEGAVAVGSTGTPAESTTGRLVRVWGLIGEITNACKSFRKIGPPADRLCAVDPTGVLMIRPSQL